MFLDDSTLFILLNAFLAISILLLISTLHFTFTIFCCYTSQVDHFLHFFNCCSIQTYTSCWCVLFLTSYIDLVFCMVISIPYGLPLSFTVVKRFCNFCTSRASNDVSSACLKLLILCPQTFMPSVSSISLNISLVYRLNKLGGKTHPCLTPFFIWNSSVMLCYLLLSLLKITLLYGSLN